jgi:tetratricopeptide (TPR) repeat protein
VKRCAGLMWTVVESLNYPLNEVHNLILANRSNYVVMGRYWKVRLLFKYSLFREILLESMTPEEAIQFADKVLLSLNDKPLTDIQRMILSESLAGKSYDEMSGHSTSHIKSQGSILWELLTVALKENIGKKSCRGVLEKRLRASGIDPKQPMLSTYNEQTWVGRETLIGDLFPKLQGQTRLLWITGISGIGKTAFGECLVNHAWKSDPSFQWIYLEILEGQSPDFTSVVAELLAKLGDNELNSQEQNNPDLLAKRLLQKLRSHHYWLQLDSLERLLDSEQTNEFIDPYWATFLQRCLTDFNIISRLVLTSQVFPRALIEFSDRYSNTWLECRLSGLLQVDRQLEFFAKRKVVVESSNRDILIRIATIYEGHPLVLKVISEDILNGFAGNVLAFWQIYQPEFEQVSRELQATRPNETEYNEALYRKVRERIRQSLDRIPPEALDLLCRSAVFRRPVSKKFWLAMLENFSSQDQTLAYQALDDRALIEKEGTDIRQHNLIRSVAYDLLKTNIFLWDKAERQAANLWLNAYKSKPNSSNLENVRGYLEAFDHYGEVGDWKAAKDILITPLDSFSRVDILRQLQFWGLYQDGIQLCQKILKQFDSDTDIICFKMLGNYHYHLSNYSKSIDFYQQSLSISKEIGNHCGEGNALCGLGIVYDSMGLHEQAIDFYKQHLMIAREINDRQGESISQGNQGLAYNSIGDYKQAIICHQQHLKIAREIGDRYGEGNALNNLGLANYSLGLYQEAINFYQQYMVIVQDIGDRRGEAISSGNLGNVYRAMGNYQKAFDLLSQKLVISREIRSQQSESYALQGLGETLIKLEQYDNALQNLGEALKICQEIGENSLKAEVLKSLSELYRSSGEKETAQQYCQQALALAKELGLPLVTECEVLQQELLDGYPE